MRRIRQPWHIEPSPSMWAAVERGLRFLDERLPVPLRAPEVQEPVVNAIAHGRHRGHSDKRALNQRDAAIVSAIAGGAPTEHVASSFSISVSQVNKIVRNAAA